jgi:Cu-Zn family superoxide dismutase
MIRRARTRNRLKLGTALVTGLLAIGCTTSAEKKAPASQVKMAKDGSYSNITDNLQRYERLAVAELEPKSGSQATGTVTFRKHPDGLLVIAEVMKVKPAGPHGIHIHEKGDCSAPDGKSAGGHYNPTGEKHGRPNSAEYHFGDLGNIVIDKAGNGEKALVLFKTQQPDLDAAMIYNKAVILHDKEDKFVQPTGAAGKRLACGVIEKA